MVPSNWPKDLVYSPESRSKHISCTLLKQMLFSLINKEKILTAVDDCIGNKKVYPDVEIRSLQDKSHPLSYKKGEMQRGLFASKQIEANTFLGEYVGDMALISSIEEMQPRDSAYYFLVDLMDDLKCIVDPKVCANELAMVNDYRGIAHDPNCKPTFVTYENQAHFGFYTTRVIPIETEILVDYGELYWSLDHRKPIEEL